MSYSQMDVEMVPVNNQGWYEGSWEASSADVQDMQYEPTQNFSEQVRVVPSIPKPLKRRNETPIQQQKRVKDQLPAATVAAPSNTVQANKTTWFTTENMAFGALGICVGAMLGGGSRI